MLYELWIGLDESLILIVVMSCAFAEHSKRQESLLICSLWLAYSMHCQSIFEKELSDLALWWFYEYAITDLVSII